MKIDHQLKHEFNSVTSNAYFGIHFCLFVLYLLFSMQSNSNLVTAVISIIIVAHKNIYAFIAFNNKFHFFSSFSCLSVFLLLLIIVCYREWSLICYVQFAFRSIFTAIAKIDRLLNCLCTEITAFIDLFPRMDVGLFLQYRILCYCLLIIVMFWKKCAIEICYALFIGVNNCMWTTWALSIESAFEWEIFFL